MFGNATPRKMNTKGALIKSSSKIVNFQNKRQI